MHILLVSEDGKTGPGTHEALPADHLRKVFNAKIIGQLSSPGVTISAQIPDDLPLVNIDSGRIEVVLHNLVANALVYGEGEVRITAQRREDAIIVSVSDNGPGIDPDELPHVFERFYRVQYGHHQHSGGTGLGLAICRAFIEAHGGAIWTESSVQGTMISFSLSLVSVPIETEAMEFSTEEWRRL